MAEHRTDSILIDVATTIADGLPVDWESLIYEHPELSEQLEGLRLLQKVPEARKQSEDEKGAKQ